MSRRSSLPLRVVYIVCILGMVAPIGLASSGWVGISLGRGGMGIFGMFSAGVMLCLGLWRAWLVAAKPSTLDSPQPDGILLATRNTGVFLLYAGAVMTVLNWFGRPLIRALVSRPSDNGVEFYVAGIYLAMLGGIGALGLILFEFSRLRAFETSVAPGDS